ncbi:MAG: HPF/RaiA family ribosome-associated protein, partial [Pseudomonadales bacterium]|nr:HPF/RaiA family ribosome-associated protein [Pseudomonadales bacterium]
HRTARRIKLMTNDFQIVFHNIDQSAAIIDNVNKRISKLQRYNSDMTGGRVVLDSPHNNHAKGKVYSVTVEIHTPNKEVVVNQDKHDNHAHEDLYVAIRDAFNAAERQLKAAAKKPRNGDQTISEFVQAREETPDVDDEEEPDFAQAV